MRPKPIPPKSGQESVWDYPRPPALEPVDEHVRIVFDGRILADTRGAWRVLETSHPPVYYLPPGDLDQEMLEAAEGESYCEWKGRARYVDVVSGKRRAPKAGWFYPEPTQRFARLADYIAFYAHVMDACFVGDEQVTPQPGGFYGGWVTSKVVGPFKGGPGSWGW
jgi:uncharacterized protein (DUF427 family)